MTRKEMTRRGFLIGSVTSGLAALLGIGAKVVEEEPEEDEWIEVDRCPNEKLTPQSGHLVYSCIWRPPILTDAEIRELTPSYAKKVLELKPILYKPGDGRFLVAPHFEGDLFVSKAIRDQADWPGGQQC